MIDGINKLINGYDISPKVVDDFGIEPLAGDHAFFMNLGRLDLYGFHSDYPFKHAYLGEPQLIGVEKLSETYRVFIAFDPISFFQLRSRGLVAVLPAITGNRVWNHQWSYLLAGKEVVFVTTNQKDRARAYNLAKRLRNLCPSVKSINFGSKVEFGRYSKDSLLKLVCRKGARR
jgi:hypothetical protein